MNNPNYQLDVRELGRCLPPITFGRTPSAPRACCPPGPPPSIPAPIH
jgi:hypothetical protein